ncbi:MAG: NADH-quinone oxidoreductase subunit B family protein [Acidimicrobiales bacterium]|nr:NADH:ubiquinone oxidoreductase [Actinomycetota bacterium]MDA8183033.1 NADH:ubiquinone oxidoreductase [Actinomycetota bacterium]
MPWISRGLRGGILTSRYPAQADGYGERWAGTIRLRHAGGGEARDSTGLAVACPTQAIAVTGDGLELDRGRCVVCGRCVTLRPDLVELDHATEVGSLARGDLVVSTGEQGDEDACAPLGAPGAAPGSLPGDDLARLRASLELRTRALRRSVHVRHVDAGSDGSEEWEIAALTNPVYDVQRLGIFFTASPKHADVLLVTGAATAGMIGPLRQTYEAMPSPKVVIAAGTDAVSGGLLAGGYATDGGIGSILPVDVWIPGSPPSPFSLLHGILLAVCLLPAAPGRNRSHDTRPALVPHQPGDPSATQGSPS